MNINDIYKFIQKQDLDIRKKGGNPRFIDQKCTPDMMSFIADCIANLGKTSFSSQELWKSEYFAKNAVLLFGKPSPKNKKASNEYDKVISQPLDLLSYANILEKSKIGRKNHYTVKQVEILEYIGLSHRESFEFLYLYLDKILTDSNFKRILAIFLTKQDIESFILLKDKFASFIIASYGLGARGSENGGKVEANRIFPKVINIFSAKGGLLGVVKGRISKHIITFNDIMYNRVNFRDAGTKKLKNITRKESKKEAFSSQRLYNDFLTNKAMKWVKKLHTYSEVNDRLYGPTASVHHIFPKAQFPEISFYKENLIALTAGQHQDLAHPRGNCNKIDVSYQKICLKAKKQTIEGDINHAKGNYSRNDFVYVLNVGFDKRIPEISTLAKFPEIERNIDLYYKEH